MAAVIVPLVAGMDADPNATGVLIRRERPHRTVWTAAPYADRPVGACELTLMAASMGGQLALIAV